jgi:transcriptional regulator with XRE-family HTH domain
VYVARSLTYIQALTEARKKAALSQQQLADALSRPQSFVAKYEIGERRLDVIEVLEIAIALEIPASSIIRTVDRAIKQRTGAKDAG